MPIDKIFILASNNNLYQNYKSILDLSFYLTGNSNLLVLSKPNRTPLSILIIKDNCN